MSKSLPSQKDKLSAKTKTLFMVGNAHIDPVWLWQWHEGMQEIKATFRSALDRLQEFDDFIFSASSAAFYAWIEENEPAMFREIQDRVREGRWEIVGGWWVEPDCNIPGGESFVRQALYGQHYFISRFGKQVRVGYNPDSFGHTASLPQILKRSGCDFYAFMRPGPHENDALNQIFWWEADDGSRILSYRIPYAYTAWGNGLEAHIRRCIETIPEQIAVAMCFYGVGNHGGGPTQDNINLIHTLNQNIEFPHLAFSGTAGFFEKTSTSDTVFPVIHDELQHHASGCYSAHSGVKIWNRRAENALISAEKWAALATWVTGMNYPKDELESAWKLVLFNQFHDILAGTSIESAYNDACDTYSSAITTADHVRNAALQKLAWTVATPLHKDGFPLIIFNPHAWYSTVPIEVELGWFDNSSYKVVSASGYVVESQNIQSHTSLLGSQRLCFVADLPPLGYNTYWIIPGTRTDEYQKTPQNKPVSEWENCWFHLTFDTEKGGISQLYDKVNNCDVFSKTAAQAVVFDDPSDTWSHGVFRYNRPVGEFTKAKILVLEGGMVKTTFRINSYYGLSQLTQEFTLYNSIPRIDVQVTVDWHEQHKVLKLCFPVNITDAIATYEIPYGHIVRPADGEEEPGQSWIDVTGTNLDTKAQYGLSLLNNGKYSYSIEESECHLTVLRSPIYAHHTPYEPDPKRKYSFIDQGVQQFKYTLLPHAGTWKQSKTVRHAAELNQPVFAIKETYHPRGQLPQSDAFLTAKPDNILISSLKQAENDHDLIIRCVETQNTATEATIKLYGRTEPIVIDFAPSEIVTLRIPADRTSPVLKVNLLEYEMF